MERCKTAVILPTFVLAALTMVTVQANLDGSSAQSTTGIENNTEFRCGDLSPLLKRLGDHYFDLSGAVPTSGTSSTSGISGRRHSAELTLPPVLKRLLASEFSSGTGQRTQCFGSAYRVQPRRAQVTLTDISSRQRHWVAEPSARREDEFPAESALIELQAFEYQESLRRIRSESVVIPLYPSDTSGTHAGTETRTDTRTDTGSDIDDSTFDSDGRIERNRRYRQPTLAGSYLKEIALQLVPESDGVVIDKQVYVNGYLAEWLTWKLSR